MKLKYGDSFEVLVTNEEESFRIQQILFDAGWKWNSGKDKPYTPKGRTYRYPFALRVNTYGNNSITCSDEYSRDEERFPRILPSQLKLAVQDDTVSPASSSWRMFL